MQTFWTFVFGTGAGYAVAIFTWDKVHTWLIGEKAKVDSLRAKIAALRAKL